MNINKTTPSDPSGTPDPEDSNNLGLIIGIVGGVIGLAALTTGIIVYTKGKNKPVSRSYVQETIQSKTVTTGFCTNCGNKIPDNVQFCFTCGARKL
ncbi:unnamed protein product [marine sediment metagenome]|uniref:Zinc-ribbon domain-containing protein n=1 Tax=marine sediment metagenome TaxID=412755 RepID=X1FU82_9ZZZZ